MALRIFHLRCSMADVSDQGSTEPGSLHGSPFFQKENWKYELLTVMYTATGGQTDTLNWQKGTPGHLVGSRKHPSVHPPPATVESTRFFRCTYTIHQGLCTCDSLLSDGVSCSLPSWPRCHFINKFLSTLLKTETRGLPGVSSHKTLPSFTFPVLQRIAFGHLVGRCLRVYVPFQS